MTENATVPARGDLFAAVLADWRTPAEAPAATGYARLPAATGPAGVPATIGPAGVPAATGPAGVPATIGPAGQGVAPTGHARLPADVLGSVLARRRAVRQWSERPAAVADLVAVARAALDVATAWPVDVTAGLPIEVRLVARNVNGLATGVYAVEPSGPRMVSADRTPSPEFVLQPEFAQAPAVLVAAGPLADALRRHGGHGYRTLLVRAGAALQAAWLTGVSRGLVGTIFAGIVPDELRRCSDLDGHRRTALCALALGRGDG